MRKVFLFILLAFFGITTPVNGQPPYIYASAPTGGWNTGLSTDADLWGWYNFVSGSMTDDSNTQNTTSDLTASANPPQSDSNVPDVSFANSANFIIANSEDYSVTDANLATSHPLKSGSGEQDYAITFWFYADDISQYQGVVCKFTSSGFFRIFLNGSELKYGFVTGGGEVSWSAGPTLNSSRWYHGGVSFDATTDDVTLYLYDTVGESAVIDTSISLNETGTPSWGSDILTIGKRLVASNYFGGEIVEVLIFGKELTTAQMDSIRNGTY